MKEIDWIKAPEGAIGAFTRGDETFFVKTKQPSEYMNKPGFKGVQCDGKEYHVFTEYWGWLDKPWSGEGLPPVGTVCELRNVSAGTCWAKAHIKFASRNVLVWDWDGEPAMNGLCTAYRHALEIRPLRTPEQIAAEERREAILEMKGFLSFSDYREAERHCANLYDAGYRKVTP